MQHNITNINDIIHDRLDASLHETIDSSFRPLICRTLRIKLDRQIHEVMLRDWGWMALKNKLTRR